MATLSDHAVAISEAIEEAEVDGFAVEATSCCCGGGLVIKNEVTEEKEYIL